MKKIDKILEFLFHSKVGIGILVGLGLVVMLSLTGCFSECSDCLGCTDCNCSCGNCVYTCTDCDKAGCDANCNGCGSGSCQFMTCVCTQKPSCVGCGCGSGGTSSKPSNSISLIVLLPNGSRTNIYVSKNIQNGYTVYDLSRADAPADSEYFTSMGYYTKDGTLAVGADGSVVNASALLGSEGKQDANGFNLKFASTEAKLGEPVLVAFESEHDELIMNTIRVTIGSKITNFPDVRLEGYTLKGWRISGDASAPIVDVKNGETVFHLYDFKAGLTNSITLTPVFEAN